MYQLFLHAEAEVAEKSQTVRQSNFRTGTDTVLTCTFRHELVALDTPWWRDADTGDLWSPDYRSSNRTASSTSSAFRTIIPVTEAAARGSLTAFTGHGSVFRTPVHAPYESRRFNFCQKGWSLFVFFVAFVAIDVVGPLTLSRRNSLTKPTRQGPRRPRAHRCGSPGAPCLYPPYTAYGLSGSPE